MIHERSAGFAREKEKEDGKSEKQDVTPASRWWVTASVIWSFGSGRVTTWCHQGDFVACIVEKGGPFSLRKTR